MGMQDPNKFVFKELEPIPFGPMHVDIVVVEEVSEGSVRMNDNWSWPRACFPASTHQGDKFIVGTVKFSMPVYVARIDGVGIVTPFFHKTETDLSAERNERHREEWVRKLKIYEEHKDSWWVREQKLPDVLRERLDNFRAHTPNFDLEGWGYELVVSELAVLYFKHWDEIQNAELDDPEPDEIKEFANEHGTSGNQHGYAQVLARKLNVGPEEHENIRTYGAAMSPMGVGQYWENV
jgi:hypothetical protein